MIAAPPKEYTKQIMAKQTLAPGYGTRALRHFTFAMTQKGI